MRAGHTVRVCLTDSAQRFVTPALFEALTGHPCLVDVFDEPERGRMAHIDWARQADLLLIAPISANTLTKIAFGLGTDMLTTIALAFEGPMMVAPAMNPTMYVNPNVQEALARLSERCASVIEPEVGDVACGEYGQGKFASIPVIVERVEAALRSSQRLAGKKVVLTSGPTLERLDSVRFFSNRSSGKMGAALAQAALLMGAEQVVVVSGPVSVKYPARAKTVMVESADQMLAAVSQEAADADLVIGAAAVADYRPATVVEGKIRRGAGALEIQLLPNPDIIATVASQTSARVIGFAAEPDSDLAVAQAKLDRKGLFALAHNDVSQPGLGFGSDRNALTLIRSGHEPVAFGPESKLACALWLLESVAP